MCILREATPFSFGLRWAHLEAMTSSWKVDGVRILFRFAFAVALGLPACGASDPEPNNGVNDVLAACQIRATWANTSAEKCTHCMASAPTPACDCPLFAEFGGKCNAQSEARRSNPACTAPVDCTYACAKNDCACIDGCFNAAAECKRLVAATDGCVTDVCSPYCK